MEHAHRRPDCHPEAGPTGHIQSLPPEILADAETGDTGELMAVAAEGYVIFMSWE